MVVVYRRGRLGNVLFQYTFGRIIASSNGMALRKNFDYGNLKELINLSGNSLPIQLRITDCDQNEGQILDIEKLKSLGRGMVIDGFFQHRSYYENNRKLIKSWLFDQPVTKQNTVGVHLRFGDYKEIGWTLPESYYNSCILNSGLSNMLIFTDEPENPYVVKLLKEGAKLSGGSEEEDLRSLASCQKIVMSRSSFSWWAGFLSNAEKIYFPRPNQGWWSLKDTPHKDLFVDQIEYEEIYI